MGLPCLTRNFPAKEVPWPFWTGWKWMHTILYVSKFMVNPRCVVLPTHCSYSAFSVMILSSCLPYSTPYKSILWIMYIHALPVCFGDVATSFLRKGGKKLLLQYKNAFPTNHFKFNKNTEDVAMRAPHEQEWWSYPENSCTSDKGMWQSQW